MSEILRVHSPIFDRMLDILRGDEETRSLSMAGGRCVYRCPICGLACAGFLTGPVIVHPECFEEVKALEDAPASPAKRKTNAKQAKARNGRA